MSLEPGSGGAQPGGYGCPVLATVPLFCLATLAGAFLQSRPAAGRLRDTLWLGSLYVSSPIVVGVTVLTVDPSHEIAAALGVAIVASWTMIAVGYAYARLVARDHAERGALALAAGFGNTASAGYPLAHIAFGPAGLPLAVLYDKLQLLVPPLGVSSVIARLHGNRSPEKIVTGRARAFLLNPPLLAAGGAFLARIAGVDGTVLEPVATGAAFAGGGVGFALLGLSLPLDRPRHDSQTLGRAGGAAVIRLGGGPWCFSQPARSWAWTSRASSTSSPVCRRRSTWSRSPAYMTCTRNSYGCL